MILTEFLGVPVLIIIGRCKIRRKMDAISGVDIIKMWIVKTNEDLFKNMEKEITLNHIDP